MIHSNECAKNARKIQFLFTDRKVIVRNESFGIKTLNCPIGTPTIELSPNIMKKMERELLAIKEELKNAKELLSKNLEEMEEWKSIVKLEQENRIDQLRQEIAKMEQYQNEQQQNIVDLQKTVAALKEIEQIPQNRWDPSACHEDLTLSPDRLIVEHNGEISGYCSVFAERKMPKKDSGIFYYEMEMLRQEGHVRIGLGAKPMPMQRMDDWIAFHEGRPPFGVGDVIGCGVDLATRQIFYTFNGHRL
uniref:SPRY domain-containing protein n=1 Tax=Globodera rostochiensis TaxID=31243 RepID=A0A914HM36_GLORO